jgi:type IV secretion system protein VirD4
VNASLICLNMTNLGRGLGLALILACGFTVLASYIFLLGTGLQRSAGFPLWQWWQYLFTYPDNPVVQKWLMVSGAPAAATAMLFLAAFFYQRRNVRPWSLRRDYPPGRDQSPPLRGPSDNHGHAHWSSIAEMKRMWPGPGPSHGGIAVGEAYDPRRDKGRFSPSKPATWGGGGKAPLLVDPCREGSTHSILIAGSGSYKTTSAISSLLTWTGSAVVLDPAAELGPMLEAARRRMGHRVFILAPEHAAACGFNVLDWINIDSPIAETDVAAVVEWICGYTPRRDATAEFFKNRGKGLVTCLLAHLLWDPDLAPELKTLRTLRAAMSIPENELRKVLKQIYRTSQSRLARDLAGPLCALVDETFSGIYANADQDTSWLSTRSYADLVSGDSFKAADITDGRTDVFVSLPLKALQATPAVARCIIGALLNAAYEADGNVNGRMLFLLDEAGRLGRMEIIEVARDAGRKYGITLHLLYQSIGQIEQQWGGREGKRAWYESVSWRAYAAVQDNETARELSETIGRHGALAWSESHKIGAAFRAPAGSDRRASITYSELSVPLIRPEVIMHDLRDDAQIVIPKNGRPVLCGRAIYFRRPEFVSRVSANRFAKEV